MNEIKFPSDWINIGNFSEWEAFPPNLNAGVVGAGRENGE